MTLTGRATRGRFVYPAADKDNLSRQVAHVVSEVGEVYQARKHGEPRARELAEVADAWLGTLGLLYAGSFEVEDLLEAADRKLAELGERMR